MTERCPDPPWLMVSCCLCCDVAFPPTPAERVQYMDWRIFSPCSGDLSVNILPSMDIKKMTQPMLCLRTFCPYGRFVSGHFVPTDVLSPDVLTHGRFVCWTFCPSGCFVPPDALQTAMIWF
jgi:hypothetical protein